MRQPRQCEQCGATVLLSPSRLADFRYCSRKCQGAAKIPHLNAVRRSPKEYARPPVRRGAANNRWRGGPMTLICAQCQAVFPRPKWADSKRVAEGPYCSRSCRDAWRREHWIGEGSAQWVGGPKTYRGRGWLRIRAQVVAEQGGCCAVCGKHVGNGLPVNHIRPFRTFATVEEANTRDNLVGLCQRDHMRAEFNVRLLPGVVDGPRTYWQQTCESCGCQFELSGTTGKHCPSCWRHTCQECGREFRPVRWDGPRSPNRFCGVACARTARGREQRNRPHDARGRFI